MIDIVLKYEGAEKFSNSLPTEIIVKNHGLYVELIITYSAILLLSSWQLYHIFSILLILLS